MFSSCRALIFSSSCFTKKVLGGCTLRKRLATHPSFPSLVWIRVQPAPSSSTSTRSLVLAMPTASDDSFGVERSVMTIQSLTYIPLACRHTGGMKTKIAQTNARKLKNPLLIAGPHIFYELHLFIAYRIKPVHAIHSLQGCFVSLITQ